MRITISNVFILVVISYVITSPVLAQEPAIHTDRTVIKQLTAADDEAMFQFAIFGDRTGGTPAGLPILAQAVQETNLLDPDLVMTVGDLVGGYNSTDAWMKQMVEYRAIVDELKMPWFPVAGNHDIYWRLDQGSKEAKPANEHEENFEKHFGPLWYWFEHKDTGFLVMFTDEGLPDDRLRNFSLPDQQKISKKQMEWLKKSLDETKDLKHVFIFLHHPFWWDSRYPGNNWNDVHGMLAKHGNVRAVFAGHIHRMRYDGKRDGIEYFALAVTGGGINEALTSKHYGVLHQYNVVTVRPESYSVAAVAVGGTFDPRQFTPERIEEAEKARYLKHEITSDPIHVNKDGTVASIVVATVTNPLSFNLDVTMLPEGDESWSIMPDHIHAIVKPGQTKRFVFAVSRNGVLKDGVLKDRNGTLEGFTPPGLQLRFDIMTPEVRMVMPVQHREIETDWKPDPKPAEKKQRR